MEDRVRMPVDEEPRIRVRQVTQIGGVHEVHPADEEDQEHRDPDGGQERVSRDAKRLAKRDLPSEGFERNPEDRGEQQGDDRGRQGRPAVSEDGRELLLRSDDLFDPVFRDGLPAASFSSAGPISSRPPSPC